LQSVKAMLRSLLGRRDVDFDSNLQKFEEFRLREHLLKRQTGSKKVNIGSNLLKLATSHWKGIRVGTRKRFEYSLWLPAMCHQL
jgi:hypothetical protein